MGLLVSQIHQINNKLEYENDKEGVGRNSDGLALHDIHNNNLILIKFLSVYIILFYTITFLFVYYLTAGIKYVCMICD